MHRYEKVFTTSLPAAVANYKTLLQPFDKYVWGALAIFAVTELILLTLLGKMWKERSWSRKRTEVESRIMEGKMGYIIGFQLPTDFISIDVMIVASPLMHGSVSAKYLRKECFLARKVLLSRWLPLAAVLSMSYQCVYRNGVVKWKNMLSPISQVDTAIHTDSDTLRDHGEHDGGGAKLGAARHLAEGERNIFSVQVRI